MKIPREDLDRLITVARRLGDLREKVVFLGGAVVGLLLTDPACQEVRPTEDVDLLIETVTYARHVSMEEELRRRGFRNDQREGAPLCRWLVDGYPVDIMPSDSRVLGFSNEWYPAALRDAGPLQLEEGLQIRLISAPCFLATKLSAFRDRGDGDFLGSPDLEDIVTVLDGRREIEGEIGSAAGDLRLFLAESCARLLKTQEFRSALPGHLGPDGLRGERADLVLRRMKKISSLEGT
jgi:hypothetical protein